MAQVYDKMIARGFKWRLFLKETWPLALLLLYFPATLKELALFNFTETIMK